MRPLPTRVFEENIIGSPSNQRLMNGLGIFLAICAILYFGQDILIPVVLAVLLSLLLAPCVKVLQKINIPKSLAIIIVVCTAFVILSGVAAILATSLTKL